MDGQLAKLIQAMQHNNEDFTRRLDRLTRQTGEEARLRAEAESKALAYYQAHTQAQERSTVSAPSAWKHCSSKLEPKRFGLFMISPPPPSSSVQPPREGSKPLRPTFRPRSCRCGDHTVTAV